jgi:hypothetical protein
LSALQRYFELEGWVSKLNIEYRGTKVPLLLTLPDNNLSRKPKYAAIGTFPALLDRNLDGFHHPLYYFDNYDDVTTILLEDYILERDLPTAYNRCLNQLGR